jgi:hypothetical protein
LSKSNRRGPREITRSYYMQKAALLLNENS